MEQKNNSVEVLNIVRSILFHINNVNLAKMTKKMIDLLTNNHKVLEEVTDIIFNRALNRDNYIDVYAQLCATMIEHPKLNGSCSGPNPLFKKTLLKKCKDVFFSFKTYEKELDEMKTKMKNSNMRPEKMRNTLNNFLFEFNKKAISNCRFIGELYKKGVFPEKIIMSCITDLANENGELQMHCLCIILELAGPILPKTYNLKKSVDKLLFYKDYHNVSSTLKCLIQKVQKMHSKGWRNKEPVKYTGKHYSKFSELPLEMKNMIESKSCKIMTKWIYYDCYDIVLNFADKNNFDEEITRHSLNWIQQDPISFVVTIILVALEENPSIIKYAGKLLDNLNKKRLLSNHLIRSGINIVLNDSGIQRDYPNLSISISEITSLLHIF